MGPFFLRWGYPISSISHACANGSLILFAVSLGPRICIGMELAMTELKLVSIFLTRSFDIREAWDEWDKERYVPPSYTVNRLVLARDGVYRQSTLLDK